jgi:glycosyltransferase involved in cell wall biosynthesis
MYRLHQGLRKQGHDSRLLVGSSAISEPEVVEIRRLAMGKRFAARKMVDSLARFAEWRIRIPFDYYATTRQILYSQAFREADIVHLHNLHGRYFNYRLLPEIAERKPVVWTLHDMWALTGHCAYSYDCERWLTGCGNCPLLKGMEGRQVEPPGTRFDLTQQVWRTKGRVYGESTLHVVTPSRWLLGQARRSVLSGAASFQHIPYGVDLSVFRPRDRSMARRALELPLDAKVVLFAAQSAASQRKGFHFVLEGLKRLMRPSVVLLTLGANSATNIEVDGGRIRSIGTLTDERLMNLAYCAADLLVFPSLADNLPLVLVESLAAGTPSVSFNVGGVPELVRHMETGYLARYEDIEDLICGIKLLLDDDTLRMQMSQQCRAIAESGLTLELQALRYVELYEGILHQ